MSRIVQHPATGLTSLLFAWLAAIVVAAAVLPTAPLGAADDGVITIADDGNSPVIDEAHVIDADTREKMTLLLHQLKARTGVQVKVLTTASLGSEDIFAFTERHFELWKLGQKGKDNGVLVVLAPKEHKVRIHTGYGEEGVMPDSWCGTMSRQAAKLYFSRGQFAEGLLKITQAIAERVSTAAQAPLAGLPKEPLPLPNQGGGDGTTVFVILFLIFVVFIIVMGQIQQRNQRRWGNRRSGFGRDYFPYSSGPWISSGGGWGGSSGGWGGGGGGGGSDFGGGGSTGGGGGGASW